MRTFLDTVGGLLRLGLLFVRSGCRLRGPYWSWRIDTAFGADPQQRPPRRQMIGAMLEYARWMHRLRRH